MAARKKGTLAGSALWFCASLQLFLGAVPAFGFVLCRADDGHVAIEAAHGALPCATEFRRHHPTGLLQPEAGHHACDDTALLPGATGLSASRAVGSAAPDVTKVLPISSPLPSIAGAFALRRHYADPDRNYDNGLRFRTTVLLI